MEIEIERHKVTNELAELIEKVDTAVWCWSVKKHSRSKVKVDWKAAFDELMECYSKIDKSQYYTETKL